MRTQYVLLMVFLTLAPVAPCLATSPSDLLKKLEEADQADRAAGSGHIDWSVVGARDAARRAQALEVIRRGEVRTCDDFLNAAVVFQHGDAVEDTELALALATIATRMGAGKDAATLTAQATDRILVKRGKPQWYGTQFSKNKVTGKWEMAPMDAGVVSEEQREALGIPTLSETQAHLDAMNAH